MDLHSVPLASAIRPICVSLLEGIGYPGAPKPSAKAVETLLDLMHKRAVDIGLSLDTSISRKGFWLGYSEGLLAHPNHPVEVQAYVGLLTWLVVQFDDIVGQEGEMREASCQFHERFYRGETQPNVHLNGLATMIREATIHFDSVLATLLQNSILNFITSCLLEQNGGFKTMDVTQAGVKFPYYFRAMSGMDIAYAIFCYPKALYPDIGCFIEAIPDMGMFINLSNDVLSLYKEELGGDTRNYIHNRARSERKHILQVLVEVKEEAINCELRIQQILSGRDEYTKSWSNSTVQWRIAAPEIVMLDQGADVNVQGGGYGNALQAASWGGHREVVQLLLDNKADVNAHGGRYGNALHIASLEGHKEIVQLLLDNKADWSVCAPDGFTPFTNASYNGHLNVVKLLLQAGADFSTPDMNGWTPLCVASSRGHAEIVEALITIGARDIDTRGIKGRAALAWAAKKGHTDIVKLLIGKGADTLTSDLCGATCFFLAAQNGHLEALQTLLGHDYAWDVRDNLLSDALQISILAGHPRIETYLVSVGALIPEDIFGFNTFFQI